MRWFLMIIVFIASFHATWTALRYINRAPTATPSLESDTRTPEIPSQNYRGVPIKGIAI
jgi:hypothetical protein